MAPRSSLPAVTERIIHEDINQFIRPMFKPSLLQQLIYNTDERIAEKTIILVHRICLCDCVTSIRTTKNVFSVTLTL